MQGTILILDGVATSRIMLKVQLSAAYYHVVQADRLDGVTDVIHRTRPDLILAAATLPDGTAADLHKILAADETLQAIPFVVVAPQNDKAARLRALSVGADDVLSQPLDDMMLQARIRRLIRARNQTEELRPKDGLAPTLGLAEPMAVFSHAAQVAIITRDRVHGTKWRSRLAPLIRHDLRSLGMEEMHHLIADEFSPDAIVIGLSRTSGDSDLRVLADLRARSATRHAAIIAVTDDDDPQFAADALDLGADDVLRYGLCSEELSLRLDTQLRRKQRWDQMRNTLQDGMRAALRDPMTGLYNRRYALPHLAKVVRHATESGRGFAVMLADLDHFKRINDQFGHPVGDAVLKEAAQRLRDQMRPGDMLARIGGEEFLIVLEDIDPPAATLAAQHLCQKINATPVFAEGCNSPIHLTVSIGVVVGPSAQGTAVQSVDNTTKFLIGQADRALYEAKDSGRNQINLISTAA